MVAIDGLGCISTELLGLRLFKLKVDNNELRFIIVNDEKYHLQVNLIILLSLIWLLVELD